MHILIFFVDLTLFKTLVSNKDFLIKLTVFSHDFSVTSLYDYVFPENGLVAYKNGELIAKQVSSSLLSLVFSLNVSRSLFLLQLQSNLSTIATLMT